MKKNGKEKRESRRKEKNVKGSSSNNLEITRDVIEKERENIRKELEMEYEKKIQNLEQKKEKQLYKDTKDEISKFTRKRKINKEETTVKKKK